MDRRRDISCHHGPQQERSRARADFTLLQIGSYTWEEQGWSSARGHPASTAQLDGFPVSRTTHSSHLEVQTTTGPAELASAQMAPEG